MQIKIELKIFLFILLFFLTKQIETYGLLMAFALLHELGHLVCGVCLKLKPKTLKIMPLGISLTFEDNSLQTNQKKMLIAIARTSYKFSYDCNCVFYKPANITYLKRAYDICKFTHWSL